MKIKNDNPRKLYDIADEIRNDWKVIDYAAMPYLDAMSELEDMDDLYGLDNAKSIVLYFLSNAGKWRSPAAEKIKAELNAMLKNA